jgi:hypothetical protein
VSKNRPHQQKAWANGITANMMQAHLCALAHNLLTLLLSTLEKTGLTEQKLEKKHEQRISCNQENQRVPAQEMVRHAAQMTCQFIRLVRHCLFQKTTWRLALPLFQARLKYYL